MNEILRCRDLSIGYGSKVLAKDIKMSISEGMILSIVGPNGAGKSTLLRTIEGSLPALGGTMELMGKPVREYAAQERARITALVHTGNIRTSHITGYDAVALGRFPYTGSLGIMRPDDEKAVDEAIEAVDAFGFADQEISAMSDGQRQRIWLARAIAQEPKLLLLDEPTSFLDIKSKADILSVLKELASKKGVAIIMSIHDISLAAQVSDLALSIDEEHRADFGSAQDILSEGYIRKLFLLPEGYKL